jgi:hypothetical protein
MAHTEKMGHPLCRFHFPKFPKKHLCSVTWAANTLEFPAWCLPIMFHHNLISFCLISCLLALLVKRVLNDGWHSLRIVHQVLQWGVNTNFEFWFWTCHTGQSQYVTSCLFTLSSLYLVMLHPCSCLCKTLCVLAVMVFCACDTHPVQCKKLEHVHPPSMLFEGWIIHFFLLYVRGFVHLCDRFLSSL